MAKVYRRVKGRKTEKFLATMDGVQEALEDIVYEAAVRAEANLRAHRHDGHAEIDVEHGDVDWYLILSDDRGQKAALSIEYGRRPTLDEYGNPRGGMDGLFILHDAFDLRRRRR